MTPALVAPRIVTVGEGMIEIAGGLGPEGRIATAGDVLNVTVALARLGHRPALLTALGRDAWSDALLRAWAGEGVDVSLVARHPERVPGLYGVTLDAHGERSFTYWRSESAARDLFALPEIDALLAQAAQADLLFLSGITLSLYDDAGRARLVSLAADVRARGGHVAFDGNYRPRGWQRAEAAAAAFDAFAPHVSVALPTRDDEAAVHGEDDPYRIAERWHALGTPEVVVKLGAEGALVSHPGGSQIVPTVAQRPVDTSGAGDAFGAAYLAARLSGADPATAAARGHALAGITIRHPGAIPPRDAVADWTMIDGHIA